jgi:hypothetical protein
MYYYFNFQYIHEDFTDELSDTQQKHNISPPETADFDLDVTYFPGGNIRTSVT